MALKSGRQLRAIYLSSMKWARKLTLRLEGGLGVENGGSADAWVAPQVMAFGGGALHSLD